METTRHSKMPLHFYQTTGCTSQKTIIFSMKNSKKLCSTIYWYIGSSCCFNFQYCSNMVLSDWSSSSTSCHQDPLNMTVQVSIHNARTKILKFQWHELLRKQRITLLKSKHHLGFTSILLNTRGNHEVTLIFYSFQILWLSSKFDSQVIIKNISKNVQSELVICCAHPRWD